MHVRRDDSGQKVKGFRSPKLELPAAVAETYIFELFLRIRP